MTPLELLKELAKKHRESVKRLDEHLKGVERALDIEKGKLAAIEEAIKSLE